MTAPSKYKDPTRSELEQQLTDARRDLDAARNALHEKEERFRNGQGFICHKQHYPTEFEIESSILSKAFKDFDVFGDPLVHHKLQIRFKFDYMRVIERQIEWRRTYVEKAQKRVSRTAHCLDIARIDLYEVQSKSQRVLEHAVRKLRSYEAELAAGDETYRARKDHQEGALKQHSLLYARSIARRQASVKCSENMMGIDKRDLRYWEIFYETGDCHLALKEIKMI